MNLRTALCVLGLTTITCSTAWAHPGHVHPHVAGGGFAEGLFHPLFGLDHLLAMFAVGLLGVQLGGRALWALPAAFLGMMIVGGGLAMAGYTFQFKEMGVAISVVALGLALVVGRKYPLVAAAVVIGFFGLLHGHAHGTEMPAMAAPALYALGFVVTTAALHFAGIVAGLLLVRGEQFPTLVRISGAAISIAGVLILLQQFKID